MSDQEPQATLGNLPEFSVSELSTRLKRTVEEAFGLVRVRGEISGCKRAGSGHFYLTLKDADANLDGVMWKGSAQRLTFRPEDGLEVICTGRLTTYPSRSRYQLVIERMEPAGAGALMALLDERRRRLAAEGLFDAERKRPLPYLPELIGVVTSPTGAVIRDILHRLGERFPRRVLLWPVLVQGEQAAAQIAAAIDGFNRLSPNGPIPRPDLLIVARGGGSLEDLWAFNEEIVVRAAAASTIPLISAVGHETDTTLIDYAADRRAPTPTAAAEIAVPVRAELLAGLLDHERRLLGCWARGLERRRERLTALARALGDPRRLLETAAQRLDDLGEHLRRSLAIGLERRRVAYTTIAARLRGESLTREIDRRRRDLVGLDHRLGPALQRGLRVQADRFGTLAGRLRPAPILAMAVRGGNDLARLDARLSGALRRQRDARGERLAGLAARLDSLSYHRVLERGYAAVWSGGKPVTRAAQLAAGQALEIEFHDGRQSAQATGTAGTPGDSAEGGRPAKPAASARRPAKSRRGEPSPQGSLL